MHKSSWQNWVLPRSLQERGKRRRGHLVGGVLLLLQSLGAEEEGVWSQEKEHCHVYKKMMIWIPVSGQ